MNHLSPYLFKNGKSAHNRVVVPPMASSTADSRGFATDATIAHYRRLASSGAGIVFVEYSFVHSSGRSEARQLGADEDAKIPGLARIASAIHDAGALAGLQIVHAGAKTSREFTGGPLIAPSPIAVPVKDREMETPDELRPEDIALYVSWWSEAARRASDAGFDIVELHAAHGYGLNQWLSPLTNRRNDAYGGDPEKRARLLLRIFDEIRTKTDLLMAVRLAAHDHLTGGLSLEESRRLVGQLEARGLQLLDVSSGIGGWKRPQGRDGEGYLVADAQALKAGTSLPVIGVGGIRSNEYIDRALQLGWLDFAAVGRAILADPELWKKDQMLSTLG